ncbi:MAG: bifunctional 4-hydroxy-2-oxoglutarate aldolase/2-dehydro-3-deoxy-phosphogluconate aldolase [Pseudomonadota bacterium]
MTALEQTPVIPLIQSEAPETAVQIAEALKAGGLTTLEVVWRTDTAMDCVEAIRRQVDGVYVGAGTVLSPSQVEEAHRRGAEFIVSPGLHLGVVEKCQHLGLDIFPGTATPSEVQLAVNAGLKTVKFFPAALNGGPPMLKALSSVFRNMKFMPTGGVSAANLASYLELPSVIACGGSWLTPNQEIEAGNFDALTKLAQDAVSIARTIRSSN